MNFQERYRTAVAADILNQEKHLLRELNLWTNYNACHLEFVKVEIRIVDRTKFSRSGNVTTYGHNVLYKFSLREVYNPNILRTYMWGHEALFPTVEVLEEFTTTAKFAMLKVMQPDSGVAV